MGTWSTSKIGKVTCWSSHRVLVKSQGNGGLPGIVRQGSRGRAETEGRWAGGNDDPEKIMEGTGGVEAFAGRAAVPRRATALVLARSFPLREPLRRSGHPAR